MTTFLSYLLMMLVALAYLLGLMYLMRANGGLRKAELLAKAKAYDEVAAYAEGQLKAAHKRMEHEASRVLTSVANWASSLAEKCRREAQGA